MKLTDTPQTASGREDNMTFLSVTFEGLPVSAYDDAERNYTILTNTVRLYSGDIFASVSTKKTDFPRSFECSTDDITEIDNLADKIGVFGVLVIGNETFENCYITALGGIIEVSRGSGIYTYKISFSQADQH